MLTPTDQIAKARAALVSVLLLFVAACSGANEERNNPSHVSSPPLTIYSPAPPSIMLHEHNVELGTVLNACSVQNSVVAMALPQSVNHIAAMDANEKRYHLPIVTTIDFLPAVKQTGPAWHAYDNTNADLKFVASLYDVVFGVLAFDESIRSPGDLRGKKIGAPPRPSAVRVYTEALLRDGWGILDEVEIVDVLPPDLTAAIADGRIDATTWSLLSKTTDGFRPMMPPLLSQEGAHWIKTGEDVSVAINAANDFKIAVSSLDQSAIAGSAGRTDGAVSLLSFKQALAAWETTSDETVKDILTCIEHGSSTTDALPVDVTGMANWPHLERSRIHPAAVEFYSARGVVFE